jgi:hypothetical protein
MKPRKNYQGAKGGTEKRTKTGEHDYEMFEAVP